MGNQERNVKVMLNKMRLLHQENGKWGTAALYHSVINAINGFLGSKDITFDAITPLWLKSFESYLLSTGKSWNTISTYMRILRASYNQAVMLNLTTFKPYIFNKVYMGVVADRGNALDADEMGKLIKMSMNMNSMLSPKQQLSLKYFVLMFMLKGLPYVDIAYLKKRELRDDIISYRRKKTGRHLMTKLDEPAMELMQELISKDDSSPYLFPILHHPDGSEKAYKEYQASLKQLNLHLQNIGKRLNLSHKISSYTARHTWATMAFLCNVNPAIISQSMGHSSIKVTETYLKPFQQEIINEANRQVMNYVMK